ncbi:MAG: glycoside hydrolase family 3 N-terminal domain-containing protein [Clostridia bacterium]
MKKNDWTILLAFLAGIVCVACAAPEPEPESASLPPVSLYSPARDPAEIYAETMTLDQQIAQMFLIRCPESGTNTLLQTYDIGGLILFGRDFKGETPESLRASIAGYQQNAHTPLFIAVDEEGGTVVRASAYKAFRKSRFRAPQDLYADGGLEEIIDDCAEKDAFLRDLCINVNLAPVCDISTDPADFIYARSLGKSADETSRYIEAVVSRMRQDGIGSVLKHFPGYGNNADTHTGSAIDNRPFRQFEESDLLPFEAGARAGAGAVLVSHNVIRCMDPALPASLSPAVHQILRSRLGDKIVVMTDDLIMEAILQYTAGADAAVLAVKAGNDMLISSDFAVQFEAVRNAVQNGEISEAEILQHCIRILRWKMDLGLIGEESNDCGN